MLKHIFVNEWKNVLLIIVLLGIGTAFLYSGIADSWDEYQLIQKGNIVDGFITSTWEDAEDADSGGLIWSHGATYTYQLPDGRNFDGTLYGEGRLKTEFLYLSQPYPIEVTYLLDNPSVSRITNDLPDNVLGVLYKQIFPYWVFTFTFFILGFYVIWRVIRESRHLPALS